MIAKTIKREKNRSTLTKYLGAWENINNHLNPQKGSPLTLDVGPVVAGECSHYYVTIGQKTDQHQFSCNTIKT